MAESSLPRVSLGTFLSNIAVSFIIAAMIYANAIAFGFDIGAMGPYLFAFLIVPCVPIAFAVNALGWFAFVPIHRCIEPELATKQRFASIMSATPAEFWINKFSLDKENYYIFRYQCEYVVYAFENFISARHEHLSGLEISFRSISVLLAFQSLFVNFFWPNTVDGFEFGGVLSGALVVSALIFFLLWLLTSIYVGLICIDRIGFLAHYRYKIDNSKYANHEEFWAEFLQCSDAHKKI